MVDLADVARKHFFHPSTKGSCSIKKVLPAVMQSSQFLKDTYSKPIYGAAGGIPSTNFTDMAWFQQTEDGAVYDPYKLLMSDLGLDEDEEIEGINQGGAASYGYLRLQFEDMSGADRKALIAGMLRYCELDTLAMVLIYMAWIHSAN